MAEAKNNSGTEEKKKRVVIKPRRGESAAEWVERALAKEIEDVDRVSLAFTAFRKVVVYVESFDEGGIERPSAQCLKCIWDYAIWESL